MRVFVTGATGFIGSAIVLELINAGHQALGLARSDAGAATPCVAGAYTHRGSLEDLDSMRSGAANSSGVIHTAFIHDFLNYADAAEAPRRAIEMLGNALAGSGRPFVITSGTLLLRYRGSLATENDESNPNFPRKSEAAGLAIASRGVRVSVVRLPPPLHGEGDHGVVPRLLAIATEKGVSAYVGDGLHRWPAIHRLEFRLVLENGVVGARYHGVADEGVPFREIAEVIGRRLKMPVISKSQGEAADHFGWISHFVSTDCPASSAQTREQLGWRPAHASLIPDIDQPPYFEAGTEAVRAAGGK